MELKDQIGKNTSISTGSVDSFSLDIHCKLLILMNKHSE